MAMTLLLLVPLFAAATVGKSGGPVVDLRREYCGLLAGCKLPAPEGACTAEANKGIEGVTYDEARCADAKDLAAHGLLTTDLDAYPVYRFLGKRYRVTYLVEGRLPLSPARLAFLIDDLPLAAKLLTRLGQGRYTAEYLDDTHRRFKGSKEGTLEGEAVRIAGSTREGWLAYFGRGTSKVGFWRLGGQSLARFRYQALPAPERGLSYSMQIVVTPDNAMINRIMTLGLFRRLVQGHIREVVDDIDRASRRLVEIGSAGLKDGWTDEERARVGAFLSLP
jgi:hypothetical protein